MLGWQSVIQNRVLKENSYLGPEACTELVKIAIKEKWLELSKTFRISRLSAFSSLMQLPVFLLLIETIRRMCGGGSGLLSWVAEKISAVGKQTVSVPIETSMALEGGLWFPDLLSPDPMLILPAVLSSVLFLNVSEYGRLAETASSELSRRQVIFNRALKLVALVLFPLTLKLPAGMLIYWISSALSATLMNLLLRFAMPLQKSLAPCKPLVKPYMKDLTG